jgi:hypothetical protein
MLYDVLVDSGSFICRQKLRACAYAQLAACSCGAICDSSFAWTIGENVVANKEATNRTTVIKREKRESEKHFFLLLVICLFKHRYKQNKRHKVHLTGEKQKTTSYRYYPAILILILNTIGVK